MLNPDIKIALTKTFPEDLVDALLNSYKDIISNYRIEKWKTVGLDAGHFVEISRRMIEEVLLGSYTPLNKKLSTFNDKALIGYENASGDEAYRILIPRILYSIYCVRNKRGDWAL